jgi:guanosine-3',5'-bis(diphosphate) 3'-pyrophosphohydrolase
MATADGKHGPWAMAGVAVAATLGAVAAFGLGWLARQQRASSDVSLILRGADFAARKHAMQRRKDPERTPYVNHVIGVATSLACAGVMETDVLVAALLHDTVEDTECSVGEIAANFGDEIAGIVAEVTDDPDLPTAERKRMQVEHAPICTRKAKLVKLSDKLYNLRDLNRVAPAGWTQQRVAEYFLWSAAVIAGASGVNPELERQLGEVFDERESSVENLKLLRDRE